MCVCVRVCMHFHVIYIAVQISASLKPSLYPFYIVFPRCLHIHVRLIISHCYLCGIKSLRAYSVILISIGPILQGNENKRTVEPLYCGHL